MERGDVKSAWSGLRPLVSDPNAADTAKLSRDHVVNISDSGLLTVAGGKWTTYRKMALDTVEEALKLGGLEAGPSRTENLKLVGGKTFSPSGAAKLQEDYGLEPDTASYLNRAYGGRASQVADIAREGYAERLAPGHHYLEAEVIHGARSEGARSSTDIIARRTRLAFLDEAAATNAIPRVSELLKAELGWDEERALWDQQEARAYLSRS